MFGHSLVAGRPFADYDGTRGREVAVVDERFAASFFPGVNPVGALIRVVPSNERHVLPPVTIVGITPSLPQRDGRSEPVVYLPYRANALVFSNLLILARSSDPPAAAIAQVREAMQAVDPNLPLVDVTTLDEWLAFLRAPERVFTTMFSFFGAMALLLVAIGLYGIIAYSATQRTRELAVRIALGATAPQVQWLVVRRGVGQLAAGLVLGFLGAYGVGRLLNGVLGAKGNDPVALTAVASMLIVVAVGACFWPARRATRLDPVAALRCD